MPTQAPRKRIIISVVGMATRDFKKPKHGLLSPELLPRNLEYIFPLLWSSHFSISHTKPHLSFCVAVGVRASERLAEIDMPYLLRFQPIMRTVGQKYCVDPAVIAGVVSRESPAGNILVNAGNVGDGVRVVQVTLHVTIGLCVWHSSKRTPSHLLCGR